MASPSPVGDDNDVAFAAMAGVAVIVAVVVSVILPRVAPQTTIAAAASVQASAPAATTAAADPQGDDADADGGSTTTAPIIAPGPTEDEVLERLTSAGFPSLTVTVDGHTVTVSGDLADDSLRRAALGVVQSIDGVDTVVDDLQAG